MEYFNRTNKTVKDVFDAFNAGKLIVDKSYQRRSVWLAQDKIRLIETILMGYIVPEVFFWPATIDPDTGEVITHIVDGQQRIDAIVEFLTGKYKLISKFLLDENVRANYGDKYFSELPPEAKSKIWMYKLSIVDIDPEWKIPQIRTMFHRLNLTDYSLNDPERLNSKNSAFGIKATALVENDFWKSVKVFSATDLRRMKDTEFCCSVFILAIEGIVDQTNSKKLNQYHDDYAEVFDPEDLLTDKIQMAMDIILQFHDAGTADFISKKAQLYTMFCIAFRMIQDGTVVTESMFTKMKLYIHAYDLFRNGMDLTLEDETVASLFDSIKKYKLASSEGINKYQNRMIRYEQLYKTCITSSDTIIPALQELVHTLNDKRMEKISSREDPEVNSEDE